MAIAKKKPWKTGTSNRHVTNLKQSNLKTFNIYGKTVCLTAYNYGSALCTLGNATQIEPIQLHCPSQGKYRHCPRKPRQAQPLSLSSAVSKKLRSCKQDLTRVIHTNRRLNNLTLIQLNFHILSSIVCTFFHSKLWSNIACALYLEGTWEIIFSTIKYCKFKVRTILVCAL